MLWFNYSHIGYGPVMNALTLSRFVRDGVKPDAVVLEIMPAFFVKEDLRFQARHVTPVELVFLRSYSPYLANEWAYLRTRFSESSRILNAFDKVMAVGVQQRCVISRQQCDKSLHVPERCAQVVRD